MCARELFFRPKIRAFVDACIRLSSSALYVRKKNLVGCTGCPVRIRRVPVFLGIEGATHTKMLQWKHAILRLKLLDFAFGELFDEEMLCSLKRADLNQTPLSK